MKLTCDLAALPPDERRKTARAASLTARPGSHSGHDRQYLLPAERSRPGGSIREPRVGCRASDRRRAHTSNTHAWPMAYDAPCGGSGRYARPA
eukprot:4533354-Prymnesium_polylepis.1